MSSVRRRAFALVGLTAILAPGAASPLAPRPALAAGDPLDADPDREFFDRSRAVFEAFPRRAVRGTLFSVKFRLHAGYRDPVLVVVFPDGVPLYQRGTFESGDWVATFRLDPRGGRHRVALVVDSEAGDLTAAQFIVSATTGDGRDVDRDVELPPPDTPYPSLAEGEHPLRVERHLYHRMNAFRVQSGLRPLPWHEGVARCARAQLAESARVFEESFDTRVGYGFLPHSIPQVVRADPDGQDREVSPPGPSIADRCRIDLGWPVVVPKLPQENPLRGRGQPNFVSESVLAPDSSLDRKFEQTMLRVSDHRAPMLSEWATHAAGAALWRTYRYDRRVRVVTDASGRRRLREVVPAPSGSSADSASPAPRSWRRPGDPERTFAILAFIQVNDPAVLARDEAEKRAVLAAPGRAKDGPEMAAALRTLGRHAFPEGIPLLARRLDDADPAVAAAALDGLWLADPQRARRATDRLHVRVLRATGREDIPAALAPLRVLAGVEYDVTTRRQAAGQIETFVRAARAELDLVDRYIGARDWAQARDAFQRVARTYRGLPEAEEAALGLRALLANPEARAALDAAK